MSTDRRRFLMSASGAAMGMALMTHGSEARAEANATEEGQDLQLRLSLLKPGPGQELTVSVKTGQLFSTMERASDGGLHLISGIVTIGEDKQAHLALSLFTVKSDNIVLRIQTGEEPIKFAVGKPYTPRTPAGELFRLQLTPKP